MTTQVEIRVEIKPKKEKNQVEYPEPSLDLRACQEAHLALENA
jgi:hypothetical protein